jgi:threonine dehydrogenase-like Zn-dependent dehydrogenase
MTTIKAAILQAPKTFVVEDRPLPRPGSRQIRVRIHACGICTSELEMWEGKTGLEFPRFIGHEVGGVIEEVGAEVTSVGVGDHVVLYAEGQGYAEALVIDEDRAVRLSPNTPFDLALGEPIACATNGVLKANPQLNDSVCLVGCGFMGLIMLQIFRVRGVGSIIVIDPRDSMLRIAKSLGATHTVNPRTTNAATAVKELTNGTGVDIGVETGGNQQTLDLVTDIVRMEGKLEVFGFHQGPPRHVNWGYWNWMAFQIVNGHSRSANIYMSGMRTGLALLESGALNMKPLVTDLFPLDGINDGFAKSCLKPEGFVKAVVTL